MGGHKIRHKILVFSDFLIDASVLVCKCLVYLMLRLPHFGQHRIGYMFRRYLQLSADMMPAQFPEKTVIRICHDIIKTDSGTDKHFLHSRKFS